MRGLPEASIDLTVTSPPYDDLRAYKGFTFDYKPVAQELYRLTKPGGIVVWVVGDATKNGSESGSSFKQALYFMEVGFKLHDTMIYEKNSSAFPAARTSKRYTQIFEYMFVFCKGKIRNDITLLCDKPNKWAGHTNWGNNTQYDKDGNLKQTNNIKPVPDFSLRNNIWKYSVGFNDKTGHPAVFPEQLAQDHILSWSKEEDVVLDPFMGSGTTAKMAILSNRHYIGFDVSEEYCKIAQERISKLK
jgi:site-specific DNA-methyltransferase (adenine-specific)